MNKILSRSVLCYLFSEPILNIVYNVTNKSKTTKTFSKVLKMEEKTNIKDMENFLLQYEGGEIKLSKKYWNDGIALLCISHVEKRNALSGKMMVDLSKCVSELETWQSGKAVILYGEGQNFCSGGDLDFVRKATSPKTGFYMSYYMHDVLKRFRKLPFVTVGLVHGPALGGGAELAVFSDFIIVAEDVKLGFVHGKMGILTAWGGTTRLIQIIGERKALEMLLSTKIYSAQECLDIGIAYRVVGSNNKLEEALNFVKTLTLHDSSIIQSYIMITNVATEKKFQESLDNEREKFCPTWGSELNKEALNKKIKHVKD